MTGKHPTTMRKPELVAEAYRLGLGPSKAALDVYHKGVLLKMVTDARATHGAWGPHPERP